MAGRPRKSSFIKDVVDISSTETKEDVKPIETSEKPAEIAQEPSYRTGVVKTDSWLNVRSGPTPSNPVIGTLKNGEKITIYETQKNWGKIDISEEKWVNLDFVI